MAEEPEWMQVQKRTFTNWVNLQLSQRGKRIEDLESDLIDGTTLINLVEVLSGKSVGKYRADVAVASGTATTKNRQARVHFMENIDKALNFLKAEEDVKLVNIAGEDIVKGNMRAILGLIWTLILKYHIAVGKDGKARTGGGGGGGAGGAGGEGGAGGAKPLTGQSAKSGIIAWVNSLIGKGTRYDLDIRNLTKDWLDGRALLALCDAMQSGLCFDWNKEQEPLARAKQGIKLAKDKLKVPDILNADDLGKDEFSVLAYLDFFRDNAEVAEEVFVEGQAAPTGSGAAKGVGSSNVRLTWGNNH